MLLKSLVGSDFGSWWDVLSETNKSSPARLTAGLLYVRTAGRIRTYDQPLSQNGALSAELQRYAIWNLD